MKRLLALFLALAMALALVACGQTANPAASASSGSASSSGDMDFSGREITFGVWAGTFSDACQEAYVKPFEEMTGAKINIEEYGDDVTAKVVTQAQQGVSGYDLICGCGACDMISVMQQNNAILKLDYSKLPNAEDVYDNAKFDYAIGQYIISTNIAWNKDVYGSNPPDTMEKYFDVKDYPGTRGMISYSPTGQLEMALLADGVSKDNLYPIDIDRAYAKLDQIKPYVTKWWSSGAEIRQCLADGECDCGIFWGGSVIEGILNDGMDNIGISHDGASLIVDCFAIPSTCTDVDLAYAFLNYCLSGEACAKWAELKYYAPVTSQAEQYMPEELSSYFTSSPENSGNAFWCDIDYWTQNFEDVTDGYLLWISK